jgi:hypothetical protein
LPTKELPIPGPPVDLLRASDPEWLFPAHEAFAKEGLNWERSDFIHLDRKIAFQGSHPEARSNVENAQRLVSDMVLFLEGLMSLPHRLTTCSASMGDATSFPGMPLMTSFAAYKADLPRYITAGDDAVVARMTLEKQKPFEDTLIGCGGRLSKGDPLRGKPNKLYKNRYKFIFCEGVWQWSPRRRILSQIPLTHMSLWTVPPGGSKGSIDWFNQPSSVVQHHTVTGMSPRSRLWSFTKTRNFTAAAFKLGLPVGVDVGYGGIGHPMYPPMAGTSRRTNKQWLSTLSQLTKIDLAVGSGLSPLPSGESSLVRNMVRKTLTDLVEDPLGKRESGIPMAGFMNAPIDEHSPSIAEAAEVISYLGTSWELYSKRAPNPIKTPMVSSTAGRFLRVIRRKALTGPDVTSYRATQQDLSLKVHTFVENPQFLVNRAMERRSYGLESHIQDRQRSADIQRWQNRNDVMVAKVYLSGRKT